MRDLQIHALIQCHFPHYKIATDGRYPHFFSIRVEDSTPSNISNEKESFRKPFSNSMGYALGVYWICLRISYQTGYIHKVYKRKAHELPWHPIVSSTQYPSIPHPRPTPMWWAMPAVWTLSNSPPAVLSRPVPQVHGFEPGQSDRYLQETGRFHVCFVQSFEMLG